MTATDELRRMLDEREVEWLDSSDENVLHTTWNDMNCWFNEFPDGWTAWGMAKRGTPEQAIEATLGSERNAYKQRITGDGSDWGEIMSDAFDSLMSSASESCTPDEMRALESHITATLGGRMLTADDVRDAIERYSDASGGNGRDLHSWAYTAIADELNATLGPHITGETSDGYHTFNELYHHRAVLFSVIVRDHIDRAWKSKAHHDGTMYDGMFIVGIETPEGQATYHYDIDPYWDMFDCKELDRAPEWDGHTPDDAIERIATLGNEGSE